MIRRRSPLRLIFRIVYVVGVATTIYFVQGPLQAKKTEYVKKNTAIGQRMAADQQKAGDALDAFQKVESPQDADWETLATSSDGLSKDFDAMYKEASTWDVPREYRRSHDQVVAALRVNSQTYVNLAKAARAHDRNRMRDAVVDGNRLTQDIGGESR